MNAENTELPTSVECPYYELALKRILGNLSGEEEGQLLIHIESCEVCRSIDEESRELEGFIKTKSNELERELASTRDQLFDRINQEIRKPTEQIAPEPAAPQRSRGRIILYAGQLAAVGILAALWLVSYSSVKRIQKQEQRRFTRTEVRALTTVTQAFQKNERRLPAPGNAALVAELSRPIPEKQRPYFPFDAERLRDGRFLDPWSQPYIYRVEDSGFRIYSSGPDGIDERGGGDDIVMPQSGL